MLDYDATPDGARTVMSRVSENVRAHRRNAAAQSVEWFAPDFEVMAHLEGEELEKQKAAYSRRTGQKR
jgi:hypothetical protein